MHNAELSPRLIFWELTSGCNLRCIHCRASAQPERGPDEVTAEEAFQVIDQITAFSRPILILTGGEPLYHPDVFTIASYATRQGLRVALATNGTLVDERTALAIRQAGISRVSISLDGPDAVTHDTFRGLSGAFSAAIRGLQLLRERGGISLQVNTTVARHNVEQLPQMLDLCLRLGVDAFHLFLLVPVGCGLEVAEEQEVSPEEYEKTLNWLYDHQFGREAAGIELKATCAPHYFRVIRQRAKRDGSKVTRETHGMAAMTKGCLAGTGVCFISSTGRVQPCGYLPIEAGNVRITPFQTIWEEAEVFRELRRPDILSGKCGICEYRTLCMGCRARAFGTTVDPFSEEPYCIYEPVAMRRQATGVIHA